MTNLDLVYKAKEFSVKTGYSIINANYLVLDLVQQGRTVEDIIAILDDKIERHKTPYCLKQGEQCFILKEDGEIVETSYKVEEYFANVRDMGNLFVRKEDAEEVKMNRIKRIK